MSARLLIGDVRDRIKEIPDRSVDLVCSSPPFWGLRSYGPNKSAEMGSERTPADFIDGLLGLTAEFRRVLAPHGSIAIELGDSYFGSGGAGGDYTNEDGLRAGQPTFKQARSDVLLAKSLACVPGAYALSLAYGWNVLKQRPATPFASLHVGNSFVRGEAAMPPDSPAGRWRVRNVIVWARPNPPVGALGDKVRPATSYITVACTSDRRWFDLDAVRTPLKVPEAATLAGARPNHCNKGHKDFHSEGDPMMSNPAGAPPLDWCEDNDPTGHATMVLPTQPFSGWAETVRRVRVEVDAGADGSQRTTSPDCPVHADQVAPAPKARRGGRANDSSTHNGHSDDHHEQGQLLGFVPTDLHPEHSTAPPSSDSPDPQRAPSATPHSNASSRKDLAPATTTPYTPSVQTLDRNAGTPIEPSSSDGHHDMPPSSNGAACPTVAEPETQPRIDRISDPSSSCTCSWWVEEDRTETTSHYAVWPETLARRLIEMMCPIRVCTVCGEPSRRIENAVWTDCGHDTWRRGHVFDPFAGTFTTGAVAHGCGRDATGCELYPINAELARGRLGMFLEIVGGPDAEA